MIGVPVREQNRPQRQATPLEGRPYPTARPSPRIDNQRNFRSGVGENVSIRTDHCFTKTHKNHASTLPQARKTAKNREHCRRVVPYEYVNGINYPV